MSRPVGFSHSDETKIKMSMAAKGKAKSIEHRKNLSIAHLGKISPRKGKGIVYIVICTNCYKDIKLNSDVYNAKKNNKAGFFCDIRCSREYFRGVNSPSWRGGIPLLRALRQTPEYKAWRLAVFERDKYTCQMCGVTGGNLQADHIKRFSEFPELRNVISNGRTLCVECHRKTPNYGRRNEKKVINV